MDCGRDLGEVPGLADGQVTTGLCADCYQVRDEELRRLERVLARMRQESQVSETAPMPLDK
jgi:hypothetical protein